MNSKDKFKEIYNYQVPLDLNAQWSVLEKKMDKKEKKRPLLWIIRGIGFLLALVPVLYLLISNIANVELSQEPLLNNIENFGTSNQLNAQPYEKVLPETPVESGVKLSLNKTEDVDIQESRLPFIKSDNNKSQEIGKSQNVNYGIKSIKDETNFTSFVESTNQVIGAKEDQFSRPTNTSNNSPIRNKVESFANRDLEINVEALFSLELKPLDVEKISSTSLPLNEKRLDQERKYNCLVGFNFMAGKSFVVQSNNGINKEYFDQRRSSEKVLETIKFGLSYEYNLSSKWSVVTGANYGRTTEKLVYVNQVSHSGTTNNGAIGTYTDFNGKVETLTGDQKTHTIYDIEISRYNKLSQISIPLGISYKFSVGKGSLSVLNGMELPIYTNYTGKLIDDSYLPTDFDEFVNAREINALKLQHGLKYQFPLRKGILFSGGVLVEYDLKSRIISNNIANKYQTVLASIGILYQL